MNYVCLVVCHDQACVKTRHFFSSRHTSGKINDGVTFNGAPLNTSDFVTFAIFEQHLDIFWKRRQK